MKIRHRAFNCWHQAMQGQADGRGLHIRRSFLLLYKFLSRIISLLLVTNSFIRSSIATAEDKWQTLIQERDVATVCSQTSDLGPIYLFISCLFNDATRDANYVAQFREYLWHLLWGTERQRRKGGAELQIPSFIISAPDVGEWSTANLHQRNEPQYTLCRGMGGPHSRRGRFFGGR
jgi:hypothetical protein